MNGDQRTKMGRSTPSIHYNGMTKEGAHMRIALAQINTTGDVVKNLAKIQDYANQAAARGAELVVFPEAAMSAFGTDLVSAATTYSAQWRNRLAALATELRLTIVVGEFEATGTKVRNLLAAYQPDGHRTEYAKIHLYDAFGYKESESVEPGSVPTTLTLHETTLGLAICYDIRFPKLFAELSRAGAKATIVSASWGAGPGKVDQWKLLARARALDSNSFVIAVGQADPQISGVTVPDDAPTGVGHSIVTDPFGQVLTTLGGTEELALVDIGTSEADRAATAIPVLTNSRLDY